MDLDYVAEISGFDSAGAGCAGWPVNQSASQVTEGSSPAVSPGRRLQMSSLTMPIPPTSASHVGPKHPSTPFAAQSQIEVHSSIEPPGGSPGGACGKLTLCPLKLRGWSIADLNI
jgi:hypothetical protein